MESQKSIKSSLSCAECETLLTDFMLDLLPEETVKKIKNHLDACLQCRKAQQELELITSVLTQAEYVSPPPEFMKNLHRRLMKEQPVYLFVWNQIRYFLRKTCQIVGNYGKHFWKVAVQWWNSFMLPVLKSLAERIKKMPKAWQIGAPVLACVFVAAVISTGIFTHMHPTTPGIAGDNQLAVSDNVTSKQKNNSDAAGGENQKDVNSQLQSTQPSASSQEEKEGDAQSANPSEENGVVSETIIEEKISEMNTVDENVPDFSANEENSNQQSGDDAGNAESGAESVAEYDDNISAYSAGANDDQLFLAAEAPVQAVTSAGGGMDARSAKAVSQIPAGTMDVYTIKTSNLSQTLTNSGYAGKAITENGKTVLILTKNEYNQLQKNLLSSDQSNNEEIKYSGAVNLSHSYEWDGCFRVEITQR